MYNWLIIILFIEFIGLATLIERKIYGIWLTPFTILALPSLFIMIFTYFFAEHFGFVAFYPPVLFYWMAGLLLFWIGGFPVALFYSKDIKHAVASFLPLYEESSKKWSLVAAWFVIWISYQSLISALNSVGGIIGIGSDEFMKQYGAGYKGHIMTFGYAILAFLIGVVKKRDVFTILTILTLILVNIIYTVKSWLIIPLVAGLYYRILTKKSRISTKMLFVLLISVCAIFVLTYFVTFGLDNMGYVKEKGTYHFLFRHFLSYLFSGFLGFSENIRNGFEAIPSPQWIFSPFVNIYNVLTGNMIIGNINQDQVLIDLINTSSSIGMSNVNTFMGTLMMYLETPDVVCWLVCFGLFCYTCFFIVWKSCNCWMIVLWAFIAAGLFFGFFEYYFVNLSMIETPVYCIIMAFAFKYRSSLNSKPIATFHNTKNFELSS